VYAFQLVRCAPRVFDNPVSVWAGLWTGRGIATSEDPGGVFDGRMSQDRRDEWLTSEAKPDCRKYYFGNNLGLDARRNDGANEPNFAA
jgi:hypothetical protein